MSQRRARRERQATREGRPPQSRLQHILGNQRAWVLAGALALVAVLSVGIVVARGTGAAEPIVQAGGDTVAFSGSDPVTGKQVSLADYRGKPVVINVWGSWCPGCIAEAEDLRRFAADHPEAQVIGVDLQDTEDAARDFYERWRWTHPSVFDPDGEISFSLGLQGTPSTFFLDRKHRVITRIVGETDYAGFVRGLETALSESES
ncbi:MAG: TlpA family protein disulfide reductase [Actinobacteria bacterium]|nr:TlpA family protein disulfide reductase [Actinomycetota bacterium]